MSPMYEQSSTECRLDLYYYINGNTGEVLDDTESSEPAALGIYTLPLKSLLSLASVWSKTILNTGGVGGEGVDPQT